MKTTFFKRALMALAFTFFIISCSKDANNPSNDVTIGNESTLSRQLTNSDVTDFLDDYYKSTYTFGDTEAVSVDNQSFEVTEIFSNSTLPKGYVVTEKGTEKFLYFVDFDRVKEQIQAFDIIANENFLQTDLNEDENGKKITDIDIIAYIKDNPSSENRFWGWHSNNDCHDVYQGTSPEGVHYCQTRCTRDYFVFFINTGTQEYSVGGLHEC